MSVVLVESGQRLSRSLLWNWQRGYFNNQGATAWQQGAVPHYVTSNTFIADAYAKVVLGYLRDCAVSIDSSQPIYIVELGAGVGRFGFHFVTRFAERLAQSPLAGLRVVYVLTDFAEANVEYYLAHARLKPLFDAGQLDCAKLDVESDTEICLRHSGVILRPDSVRNPLIVIANYVWDGVQQDAFHVEEGRLHESLVTLSTAEPAAQLDDPKQLESVSISYEQRAIELPYYEDPAWNQILDGYQRSGAHGSFLFPCAALSCLARLRAIAADRLLLLSADKGAHDIADVCGPSPSLALHGSFSTMVNYHAIAEWVRVASGQSLHCAHRQSSLSLNAFVLGLANPVETRLAWADSVARGGPDDLFLIKKSVDYRYETLTLEQILALIRLTVWDAKIFIGCVPALCTHIRAGEMSPSLRADLLASIERVREIYFPIGEDFDLETSVRELHAALEPVPVAFDRSTPNYGHSFSSLRLLPPPR